MRSSATRVAREDFIRLIAPASRNSLGPFYSFGGDGIGVRWMHPSPSRDIERIKSAGIEHGFTLVPIKAADRARS